MERKGNSHLIGRALLRREYREVVDAVMGDPAQLRDERWQAAIKAYLRGDTEKVCGFSLAIAGPNARSCSAWRNGQMPGEGIPGGPSAT